MKKNGFTLIELLIVTVVIVTLMGIVFRLAGAGSDSRAKAETIKRLQRVENALSGYYAAYGSYPPVPLQGRSRRIDVRVDTLGVQGDSGKHTKSVNLSNPDADTKKQVEAACRAQPIAVLFPFYGRKKKDQRRDIDAASEREWVESIASFRSESFKALNQDNVGGLDLDETSWHEIQLFQFGLLSFLLPRYLFMLQGNPELYDHVKAGTARRTGQWAANNQLPCRLDTGRPFESWEDVQDYLYGSSSSAELSFIENLTSQAVCARWMPNFEGIVTGGQEFYGVDTSDSDRPYLEGRSWTGTPDDYSGNTYRHWLRVSSQNGFDSSASTYLLNGMTIVDGWDKELYYYSDSPYQSYRLWSSGPNRITFPPWYDLSSYSPKELENIHKWTKDDISHLAN